MSWSRSCTSRQVLGLNPVWVDIGIHVGTSEIMEPEKYLNALEFVESSTVFGQMSLKIFDAPFGNVFTAFPASVIISV